MGDGRMRAVALPLAALLLSACASQPSPTAAGAPAGSWTTVPSAPLSPRLDAVTAWTGAEAIVLGGDVGAADGAAYDPRTETWRVIADAPYPVPGGTPRAVAGDTVYLVHDDRLMSYDASEDAWSVSPPAPDGADLGRPAALDDGTVAVVDGERTSGLVDDPAPRTWSELTDDPAVRDESDLPDAPRTDSGGWPVDAADGPLTAVDGWVHDDRDGTWTRLDRPDGAPARPGSAVGAGDDLLVLGGMDTDTGSNPAHLTGDAWLWHRGGVDS